MQTSIRPKYHSDPNYPTFGTPQDITTDELRVESFFPADAATAELLRKLAA